MPTPTAPGPIGAPRSIGLTILVTIVTLGIWTWIWSYKNGNELQAHNRDGLGGGIFLVLTIFISPVTMFLMAGEIEKMYQASGKQPPVTTMTGLWFLLPLIGNLIWYVKVQRALNDHWIALGAANNPGL